MANAKQGDRVSEYVLVRRVGAGGFGEVWLARHHEWPEKRVAAKIPTDPAFVESLRRDGSVIHTIDNPHVVKALGMDVAAEPPYLLTEYVEGNSLRQILAQEGALPVEEAAAILEQILDGLAAAHARGVIHRDLKPANVLVAADGTVKLTDFGLARGAVAPAQSIALSGQFGEPGSGVSGTFEYMSPEQRRGGDLDARADVYACGILFYEMLTGERPSGADTPTIANPDLPDWCDVLFARSYCRLANRYPDAAAMAKDLQRQRSRIVVDVDEPMPVETPQMPAAETGPPRLDLSAVVRPRLCPDCGQPNDPENQFCTRCGRQIAEKLRRCGRCGAWPAPGDRFCIFCGETLGTRSA